MRKKVEFFRFRRGLYKIFYYQQVYQNRKLLWKTEEEQWGKTFNSLYLKTFPKGKGES